MSRSLSAATAAAAGNVITQPGYLMQVAFASFTGRYSSRGDVTWNSFSWIAANLQVGEIQEQPNGGAAVTVAVGNTDRAFGALVLNNPPQERAVSLWAFYEGAVGLSDPVPMFSGVIDACDITEAAVTMQLTSLNQGTLFIPRRRITRDAGFNHLLPAGRVIEFDGVRYEIQRAN